MLRFMLKVTHTRVMISSGLMTVTAAATTAAATNENEIESQVN